VTRGLVAVLLVAVTPALADEPPPTLCLDGRGSGDACSTADGAPGRCARHAVSGEYAGHAYTYEELRCVAILDAAAGARLPWLGAALAFSGLVAGLVLRRPAGRRWALHAPPGCARAGWAKPRRP
jgi:hypothetical protein